MNGKKAKMLRRQARKLAKDLKLPERDIIELNHHMKLYPWLTKTRVTKDGTVEVVEPGLRPVHQKVNSRNSFRGEYRHLKAEYRRAR